MLQQCCEAIFQRKVENDKAGNETTIYVSYLEIYNEQLKDLLDSKKKELKIFKTRQGITVQNL